MKSSILDRMEAIMNKKYKMDYNSIPQKNFSSWDEAKKNAKKIMIKPGWAVYYVRSEGYIDHISIVPKVEESNLNLLETPLLHATVPPIGLGVGPLTNDFFDRSGTRLCSAFEFMESYKDTQAYKKVFFGPPPTLNESYIDKAGRIAQQIANTGLVDGKPVVFSFGMLPILNKFYVSFFNADTDKAKIRPIKKLHQSVIPLYCGGLVGKIYEEAGIKNVPQVEFMKIKGPSSLSIFKWCLGSGTILPGLSWN